MDALSKQPLDSPSDVVAVPVFLILKRRFRNLKDPLESKLDTQYVLGHLTTLTEKQIIAIRDQVSRLVYKHGVLIEVIALLDSFDANNQARRLELLSMAKSMKFVLKKQKNQPDVELLWPHRLGLVVQEMTRAFEKENANLKLKKNDKKRGRKTQYDPHADSKVAEAWNTNQHRTYLDLAKARGRGKLPGT